MALEGLERGLERNKVEYDLGLDGKLDRWNAGSDCRESSDVNAFQLTPVVTRDASNDSAPSPPN